MADYFSQINHQQTSIFSLTKDDGEKMTHRPTTAVCGI